MQPYKEYPNPNPYMRRLGFRKNSEGRFEIFDVAEQAICEFCDLPDELGLQYARLLSHAPALYQACLKLFKHLNLDHKYVADFGHTDRDICKASLDIVHAENDALV